MKIDSIEMEPSWKSILQGELESQEFEELTMSIKQEIRSGKKIYPPGRLIFNAFNLCPFSTLKVVILGQDPYHGPGQAMGLCFSVPKAVRTPPSLVNIYKEIKRDLGFDPPSHGDLTTWAQQGVFMLNAVLTVEAGKAASHRKLGWIAFTDKVIERISEEKKGVVFMLWGNFAKQKKALIDTTKHLVLESVHPSPLAGNGFQGNNHFSTANRYLIAQNTSPINWQLS